MKLKSKLIATIVSICAAIAVMGVGVWAATESFTVAVTNKVAVSFSNFSGIVKVTTEAKKNNAAAGYDELTDAKIFDSLGATNLMDGAEIGVSSTQHPYAGAGLFDMTPDTGTGKIDADTTSASLSYKFTYQPQTGDLGVENYFTKVILTPTEEIECDGATMVCSYRVYIGDEAEASEDQNYSGLSAITFAVASGTTFTVEVRCDYTNTNKLSTQASGGFSFTLEYSSMYQLNGVTEIK